MGFLSRALLFDPEGWGVYILACGRCLVMSTYSTFAEPPLNPVELLAALKRGYRNNYSRPHLSRPIP